MHGNNVVMTQDGSGRWLVFENPSEIVEAREAGQVVPALERIERGVQRGMFAAGFVAYEAAPGMDKAFKTLNPPALPLVWFGLYGEPRRLDDLPPLQGGFKVGEWEMSIGRQEYLEAIGRIRRYIHAGDTYQVNYTTRLRAAFSGEPYSLFYSLCRAQQARNCAFVAFGDHAICSASPELFFEMNGDTIVSRPMKGTIRRGLTCDADAANANALRESPKNRAENVMIVDMIRNDLGRVARPGSVRVVSAYDVERYPTVYQMTSTVEAKIDATFVELVKALFPCASITGAPKVRTMEIIAELEPGPRGVYTGAIGYVGPGRQARFNVAIRTVVVDRKAGAAEYGVGGGIVWESDAEEEYRECLTKASVLTAEAPEFELLETMLWTPDEGYFLLDKHLRRLLRSAAYFGFVALEEEVAAELMKLAASLPREPHRIRLRVDRRGRISIDPIVLKTEARQFKVRLASAPVRSDNVFLYHKTTNRGVYEAAKQSRPDCDDVILHNEKGEITESTIANVVVALGGRKITPPVECGLLAGTFREHLIERGEIEERIVTLDDFRNADDIFLVNSVRKWISARLLS